MKRFLLYTFLTALPLLLLVGYYTFGIAPHENRDLGRLGMIAFDDKYEVCTDSTFKTVEQYDTISSSMDSDSVIWVIGDSFTYSYIPYISYLAAVSRDSFRTLNRQHLDPFQYMAYLFYIDTIRLSKRIIIESVERETIFRLARLDFALDTIPAYEPEDKSKKNMLARSREFYKKRMNIENPVKEAKLSTALFSCQNEEKQLYFYQDDIQFPTAEQIDTAVVNLNKLRSYAAERGVELVFLIAADKYEIYRPYIVNNPYPEQDWLDGFVAKVNSPYLINSADTLRQMAANGVKDLYYCNDTHWSPVGAKAVADYMNRRLDEVGF